MDFMVVAYAIIAAVVYAVFGYLKTTPLEQFSGSKFGATLAIGAIVGFVLASMGVPVTEEAVIVQLAAFAGLTAVIENILKSIWRRIFPEPVPPA